MENLDQESQIIKENQEISISELSPGQENILFELRHQIDHREGEKLKNEVFKYAHQKAGKIAFIAWEQKQPLGYIELKKEGDLPTDNLKKKIDISQLAHLARIGILEEKRGRGFAQKLLDKAQKWAQKEGKIGLWLDYRQDNIPASKFYKKTGFLNIKEFQDKKGHQRLLAVKKFTD